MVFRGQTNNIILLLAPLPIFASMFNTKAELVYYWAVPLSHLMWDVHFVSWTLRKLLHNLPPKRHRLNENTEANHIVFNRILLRPVMMMMIIIIRQPLCPVVGRRPQHAVSKLSCLVLSSAISCRSSICPGRLSTA